MAGETATAAGFYWNAFLFDKETCCQGVASFYGIGLVQRKVPLRQKVIFELSTLFISK